MTKPLTLDIKNREYWRGRFTILENATHRKSQDYLKTLKREYVLADTRIEKEVYHWYQRFASNNQVSMANAKQMLNAAELDELKWSVDEYIKYAQQNELDGRWIKQLKNASTKVHISRLEALKLNVGQTIEELYASEDKGIKGHVRGVYEDGYYKTAYEIQKGLGVGTSFTKIDPVALDRVIKKPWTTDGKTFSDRIWAHKAELNGKVQTELAQMIMRGDAPDTAINNISKHFNVSRAQAGRLVMTESAFFASSSEQKSMHELGVKRYEVVATLDIHTSRTCQEMDGKVFDLKDYQIGSTAPPFHPWCRSIIASYFEDDKDAIRIARGKNGETYSVPADMKYGEWYNTNILPNEAKSVIIGMETSLGTTVNEVKGHFVDRLIERGFEVSDIAGALKKPLHITDIKFDENGDPSRQFIGDVVTVVYNPNTNTVLTGWKTGKAKRRKYGDKS